MEGALFGQGQDAHPQGSVRDQLRRADHPHGTARVSGRGRDSEMYKMKHPAFPTGPPGLGGDAGDRSGRGRLRRYTDTACRGMANIVGGMDARIPRRAQAGRGSCPRPAGIQRARTRGSACASRTPPGGPRSSGLPRKDTGTAGENTTTSPTVQSAGCSTVLLKRAGPSEEGRGGPARGWDRLISNY